MRGTIRSAFILALALAAPSPLLAQGGALVWSGGAGVERPRFDYFVSRYHAPDSGDGSASEGAVGGRLMWPLSQRAAARFGWLSRASVGGYLVHSPGEDDWTGVWRYGAEADLPLTRAPIIGRVDPFVAIGLGATRLTESSRSEAVDRVVGKLHPIQTHTHLSVAPGVGLRVLLTPAIGVRGDARQVFDFRDRVHRNIELSGGLSIGV